MVKGRNGKFVEMEKGIWEKNGKGKSEKNRILEATGPLTLTPQEKAKTAICNICDSS